VCVLVISVTVSAFAWGWKGHHLINLKGAPGLPASMGWFKADSSFLEAHASDADGYPYRDYSDTSFGAGQWQHFLILDWYPNFHHLPHNLDSVLMLYDSVTVKKSGTNPWATKWWLDSLTAQIARGDTENAKESASLLGHFVADGHCPVHATANYNGQLTGNTGIHSRYESWMLNGTYGDSISVIPEFPHYILSPVDTAFDYTFYALTFADSIMKADDYAKLISGYDGSGTPPQAYYYTLWNLTRNFTQDLWQRSSVSVASFWYTAWLNAYPEHFTVNRRWNMISLPRRAPLEKKNVFFPTSQSDAFKYVPGAGYKVKDTLVAGYGYWLKFDSTRTVSIVGDTITVDTIDVVRGWNLIGSISYPIAISTISSIPGGLITSEVFGYNSGYYKVDSMKPGCGYWINVSNAGQLILSLPTLLQKGSTLAERIRIVPTSEMPPSPPECSFAENEELPQHFVLQQNYPNPFNPSTIIRYDLPIDAKVTLKMYNVVGQEVKTVVDEIQDAGYKSVNLNASDIASGVYFYRIDAVGKTDASKTFTKVKKMVLVK
jgi:hypothetical protein